MHPLVWCVAILTVGAVVLGVCSRFLDHLKTRPVRPVMALTAAPLDGVWYLWIVTSNGDVYARRLSREGNDEPLRCLGDFWRESTWDFSKL